MRLDTRSLGNILWGFLFFIYGGLTHFLLLRAYAYWAYPAGSDRTFVDHSLTVVGITLLGGLSVTFFMLSFLRKALQIRNPELWPTVGKGGLFGIFATFAALEVFYVLAALFHALWGSQNPMGSSFVGRFVLSLIAFQTYGMVVVVYSLPFAFSYGAVVGGCAFWSRKYFLPQPAVVERKKITDVRKSLAFGIIGLILFWLPVIGILFAVLAVIFAGKALRQREVENKRMALVGLALGLLGLLTNMIPVIFFGGQPKGD